VTRGTALTPESYSGGAGFNEGKVKGEVRLSKGKRKGTLRKNAIFRKTECKSQMICDD